MLSRLKRDVETMGDPVQTPCPPWSAFSLSLYHLRSGDVAKTLEACRIGLARPDVKSSCAASIHAVAAMAHALDQQIDLAEGSLLNARALVKECEGRDYVQGKLIRPYWFDWAIAELVIDEAEQKVQETSR